MLNVAVVARSFIGIDDENVDRDVCVRRDLPGLCLQRCAQDPIFLRACELIAGSQQLGGMLRRHPIVAQLDNGVQASADAPNRIVAPFMLNGAGYLAIGPPHERHSPATSLYHAPPNGVPGILSDAGALFLQDSVTTES